MEMCQINARFFCGIANYISSGQFYHMEINLLRPVISYQSPPFFQLLVARGFCYLIEKWAYSKKKFFPSGEIENWIFMAINLRLIAGSIIAPLVCTCTLGLIAKKGAFLISFLTWFLYPNICNFHLFFSRCQNVQSKVKIWIIT